MEMNRYTSQSLTRLCVCKGCPELNYYFTCDGLSCHQCSTYDSNQENPVCVDPYSFGDDNLDACEDGDTHCVKMKTVATMVDTESGGLLGQVVISRFCRSVPQKSNTCEYLTGASSLSITCYCDSDGCNSGPTSGPSSVVVAMTTFLGLLITTIILQSSS
ncbi:uncharacterized protein LOC135466397 [Liolophura sinensis]|uniref:uncharacterized protein LOC135466397 n=1 Tax=Liolophura sinensis TaxID=3198878 RepID=UPI003158BE91